MILKREKTVKICQNDSLWNPGVYKLFNTSVIGAVTANSTDKSMFMYAIFLTSSNIGHPVDIWEDLGP